MQARKLNLSAEEGKILEVNVRRENKNVKKGQNEQRHYVILREFLSMKEHCIPPEAGLGFHCHESITK